MMIKESTQVPNILFDKYLAVLTSSELKVLFVIIRQTYGWIDKKTGKRKIKDRITQSQFIRKTGLARKSISKALQKLVFRRLIRITDSCGNSLSDPLLRRGRLYMYYQVTILKSSRTYSCMDISELLR